MPDLTSPVLNVLLDDAFLPACGPVAEFRLEQVVTAHRFEARVDRTLLAAANLVHRGLHVVVDAAPRHAAERGECAGVRIEQHLVTLCGIGDEPERAAGVKFDVGDLQASPQPTNKRVFAAPVKLEGFAGFEGERHEGLLARRLSLLLVPTPHERAYAAVAAGVTLGADRLEHEPGGAPVTLRAMTVGTQPTCQLCGPVVDDARADALRILRLDSISLPQPATHRVSGQARTPRNLAQRDLLAEIHPPDLGQYAHRDHLCIPCSKIEQGIQSRGSKFDENFQL
ncbi:hypothetical protein BVI434_1420001 [Burkholderia vietnamiensis]|nr:hypothetical protein BVI434_1420001 [Burkholderia vietnamiensis]